MLTTKVLRKNIKDAEKREDTKESKFREKAGGTFFLPFIPRAVTCNTNKLALVNFILAKNFVEKTDNECLLLRHLNFLNLHLICFIQNELVVATSKILSVVSLVSS